MNDLKQIKPHFQYIDYLLEVMSLVGILFMIILAAKFWTALPESIPVHFNARGEPDGYGSRWMVLTLPSISVIMYVGLTILNRYPQIFNYPVKVTAENAERLFTLGTRTIRLVKTVVIIIFAFINYRSVKIALGDDSGLGKFMIPAFMIALGVIIGFMIFQMIREN